MSGLVEYVNRRRGMVAVRTEEGYSILELLGDEVKVGDLLSWKGSNPLGSETIRNTTQSANLDVFFQNHHVARSQLGDQLLFG